MVVTLLLQSVLTPLSSRQHAVLYCSVNISLTSLCNSPHLTVNSVTLSQPQRPVEEGTTAGGWKTGIKKFANFERKHHKPHYRRFLSLSHMDFKLFCSNFR